MLGYYYASTFRMALILGMHYNELIICIYTEVKSITWKNQGISFHQFGRHHDNVNKNNIYLQRVQQARKKTRKKINVYYSFNTFEKNSYEIRKL